MGEISCIFHQRFIPLNDGELRAYPGLEKDSWLLLRERLSVFLSGWQLVREWIAAELQQLSLVVVRINGKGDGYGKGISSNQMF